MTKQDKIYIGIALAAVAVWWFFLRPGSAGGDGGGGGGGGWLDMPSTSFGNGRNQRVNWKKANKIKFTARSTKGGVQTSHVRQTVGGGEGRSSSAKQTNTSPRPQTRSASGAPGPIGGGQTSGG